MGAKVMYTTIDSVYFKNMLIGAYQLFQQKYEILNQLNVFPVPDGDTGNNMLNTLKSMYSMIADVDPSEPIGIMAEKASAGAIMGARGNSGVILSQIIHGISRGLHGKTTASCGQMSKAFQYGILYAYRSVTKPVEGTILSVARGIAKGTREVIRTETDFSKILEASITCGNEALAKTPEQLQILKDANVVDAGGQGLIFFLMGCLNGLTGKVEKIDIEVKPVISRLEAKGEQFSIEYPYCTEFIISPCKLPAKEVRKRLEAWGESMIVAEGDNLIKVHIHAQRPGHVLDMAADWGTLHDIKCDNMIDQFHKNKDKQKVIAKKKLGVLAVVSGNGWKELYEKLHCDVISGGQSMNPSVQEISLGIENGHYEKYIVLPNNKNIILAAQQLQKMLGDKVNIIPSTNPMEGLAAAMEFSEDASVEENMENMSDRMKEIHSASITTAVRDSVVGKTVIHKDDYMGLVKDHEVVATNDLHDCLEKTIGNITTENTEIITVYYGDELTEERCNKEIELVQKDYPDLTFEIYNGGQPLYPMLLSAE
ncbi:DAK2 domain-containing protein [Dialister hominis]|jgi:DAK2 domain fusion protein YloV|uniref:DAK2 domain-containing protein n=3 Tax=Veillonellaceae TaxID=31977 RepID=UPI002590112A|nr:MULTISPECIES: DAK2 domain-containing protein [environmental samples]